MRLRRLLAPIAAAAAALSAAVAAPDAAPGFSGTGTGDADEWLALLNTAWTQFAPNAQLQDLSMLYTQTWNGFVEGPTWQLWWTQNSYGPTFAAAPFLPEPYRTFVHNANAMWFTWIGNGTRVGLDDPHPAPDGCLCDAAQPDGAYYKQGDGNVPIHDWALGESLGAVVTQAELLLVERDAPAAAAYLPLFNRTLALIASRRDAATGLYLTGDASNLLAPSYGAWLLPNGTRAPAFLAEIPVTLVAALDRVSELEELRAAALAALPGLLAPEGDYFIKWRDPDGTLHGVLGAPKHGYVEAVVNHDAVALGVARRVAPGLDEAIMARLLGGSVPPNPQTGGPGLRPFSFVITSAGGLDDMEAPDTSWLWQYGTWVNGGAWATCEARMMLAYFRTGRNQLAAASMRELLAYASLWRMDSPLVSWGSAVYQPDEPINTVYDMWGVPAALLRGLFDPEYAAGTLTLTPHVPHNLTALNQSVPLRWGAHRLFLATVGPPAGGIAAVAVDGAPWAGFTPTSVTLAWDALPPAPANISVLITFAGAAAGAAGHGAGASAAGAAAAGGIAPLSAHSRASALRLLRGRVPGNASLWLDASTLAGALGDGAPVALWADISGSGHDATQPAAGARPVFRAAGADGGRPAVAFDGAATFLQHASMPLPRESSVFAVLRDGGTANTCCTGAFFSAGGCNGLGTKAGADNGSSVLMIDFSGSSDAGTHDVRGIQVVAAVVYNATGAFSFADACAESAQGAVGAPGVGYMVGSRGDELGRFFNGTLVELLVYPRALGDAERDAVTAYLTAKWPPAGGLLRCGAPPPNCTLPLPLAAAAARLARFAAGMRAAGFADGRYELAHALLALRAVAAWQTRCAGLVDGSIAPLASAASERASEAAYVASPTNLAAGLATTLAAYAGAADPEQRAIYAVWVTSA